MAGSAIWPVHVGEPSNIVHTLIMATPTITITSTIPTTDEIAAVLIAQHGQRGGGSAVCVDTDADRVSDIGEVERGEWHAWIKVADVRAYIARRGLDLNGKDIDLSYRYKLRAEVKRIVKRVEVRSRQDEPTTAKAMSADSEALALAVSMGLLETYRPPRKRTDWYRTTNSSPTLEQ